jgi:lipopolysaccharide export system protein LptC
MSKPQLCGTRPVGYTGMVDVAESWLGNPAPRVGRDPHAWSAGRGRDLARGLRKANRHSRLVRILRLAVPICVVVAVAGMLANWLSPSRILAKIPNASGKLAVSGSKIVMEAPRLTGFTRDGRGYEMTAQSAVQDILKPDILELSNIRGKMDQQDKSAIDLTAVSGIYDRSTEMLALQQYIVLNSSTGYEVHLTEAMVDVRKNHIVSNRPVEVQMTDGFLTADGMEVVDDGAVIRFEGSVKMTVNPKTDSAPDKRAQ